MSASQAPLAIDLFTGLHGWAEGLIAAGWRVVGFDIEDMSRKLGEPMPEGDFQLVVQDVLTLHGSQFRDAQLIVASPPCQFFSFTAMPFSKGRALAAEARADPERLAKRLALFNACFRIQREASDAAGRFIPLIVENVRAAQDWVGPSRWAFGAYHLWGDVPALMPSGAATKLGGSWFGGYRAGQGPRNHGSGSKARKAASAKIAKIPFPLAEWIGRAWHPRTAQPERAAA